ncbi:MAG: ferritin family protein [Anaerolineae bacterium]|nr:ferritin family protein [Anaerolineae bacterium]
MDIRKIYEYALQREYEGKRFFEENAGRLKHAAAMSAFKALAGEEQKHIEFIEHQIQLLGDGKFSSIEMGDTMERAGFFTQRAQSELLDQTVLEAMVPDLPVLRMAYLIEHDFAEFYETAAHKAEGDARSVLEMLARWERIHEKLFKEFHDTAFEQYAQMPWGG